MQVPTFFDVFSGAGGLSLGLREAGWRQLAAADCWADAAATHERNLPGAPVWAGDVRDLAAARLARLLAARPAWVVGGPPCQGFSTVGKRFRDDPRNQLVREFHRIVECLQPDGFLIENVLGMRDMGVQGDVCALFESSGYRTTFHVLRACEFGVPQLRRRVVFAGRRDGGEFLGPVPAGGPPVTVADAIDDLPVLGPGQSADRYDRPARTGYQARMRQGSDRVQGHQASRHPDRLVEAISHIPDGGDRRSIPAHLQPRSGFHNSYSRLDSRKPAVAVTGNMGKPSASRCIHPTQHRGLTAREGARLQSFPDRFHFAGGMGSQRQQIANAVPPLLAHAIGLALADPGRWA